MFYFYVRRKDGSRQQWRSKFPYGLWWKHMAKYSRCLSAMFDMAMIN